MRTWAAVCLIVVEGALGVYLEENGALCHTNTLCTGESVGDLDVLDGAAQGCQGCPNNTRALSQSEGLGKKSTLF